MTQDIMDKADKALASARLLLDAGYSDGARNRAYYAMFAAAIAALVWAGAIADGKTSRTHGGLIGAFGLHLVQAALLPAELGRSRNRVYELRRLLAAQRPSGMFEPQRQRIPRPRGGTTDQRRALGGPAARRTARVDRR